MRVPRVAQLPCQLCHDDAIATPSGLDPDALACTVAPIFRARRAARIVQDRTAGARRVDVHSAWQVGSWRAEPGEMHMRGSIRGTIRIALAAALLLAPFRPAFAMCGCEKPPPPRANVRPFVGHPDQVITLFDDRLTDRAPYTVVFSARDGSSDWSRGRGSLRRDFADRVVRPQLRVSVPNVGMGPNTLSVFDQDGRFVFGLSDDQFVVIAPPISLHDVEETIVRNDFQTGVGADGTMYVAFDATEMTEATTYTGTADGLGLRFRADDVLIYNAQGFFGGWLDPSQPGLFRISAGSPGISDTLAYWRHEFRTYKEEHRKRDARRTVDGEWHADGTPHVDNFHFVLAITATLEDGSPLVPGPTPPFRLVIAARPAPTSDL
jgi:hypothetical protein